MFEGSTQRAGWLAALGLLSGLSCSRSESGLAVPDLAAPEDLAAPDLATLPQLVSTVADCSADSHPCAHIDFSAAGHVISPLLFGDGMEWTQFGHDVLQPGPTPRSPATFRDDVVAALRDMQFTLMRYPGGTLADLFHFRGAIGDVASRLPQHTLDVDPGSHSLIDALPYFGPDEFAGCAAQIGSPILLTVNVGTGTAEEAAGWVSYWKGKGVAVDRVEVGNEVYLPGPGNSFPRMAPGDYARAFDAYATAIHAVDPAVKLGVLGISDTTAWCYPDCTSDPWNQVVLKGIQQKADWMSVHNNYAPGTDMDAQAIYEAMLSYPSFAGFDNSLIEQDIDTFASPQNRGMPLGITEHASFFLYTPGLADAGAIVAQIGRNSTWAAALFSALSYHQFVRDPRVVIANHINPLHWAWQAPVAMEVPDFATYPAGYQPHPTPSAFGVVFKAYRELAGQTFVPVTIARSPTISTAAIGLAPALSDTPLLDAVGASGSAPYRGWLLLANRSLTTDLVVSVVLDSVPAGTTTLEVQQLTAADYHAKNLPGPTANTLQWSPVLRGTLPPGPSFGTTLPVPRQSLLRWRLD